MCFKFFLVINITFQTDDPLRFRYNFYVLHLKSNHDNDEKFGDQNLQYNFNRVTAKSSSGKIDKYEYLKGEEILPSSKSSDTAS